MDKKKLEAVLTGLSMEGEFEITIRDLSKEEAFDIAATYEQLLDSKTVCMDEKMNWLRVKSDDIMVDLYYYEDDEDNV